MCSKEGNVGDSSISRAAEMNDMLYKRGWSKDIVATSSGENGKAKVYYKAQATDLLGKKKEVQRSVLVEPVAFMNWCKGKSKENAISTLDRKRTVEEKKAFDKKKPEE